MAAPPAVSDAGQLDITIMQGSDWSLVLTITDGTDPYDLTGVTAAAKIRNAFADVSAVATITCTVTNAAGGELTLSLTDTETAALTTTQTSRRARLGYWDLELTVSGNVYRYFEGTAFLSQEATK